MEGLDTGLVDTAINDNLQTVKVNVFNADGARLNEGWGDVTKTTLTDRHAVTVRKATNLCALGQQLVDRDLGGFSREPEMWRRFERQKVDWLLRCSCCVLPRNLVRTWQKPRPIGSRQRHGDGFRQLRGRQNRENKPVLDSNVFFW